MELGLLGKGSHFDNLRFVTLILDKFMCSFDAHNNLALMMIKKKYGIPKGGLKVSLID
jgi:hypothetical protein